MSERQSVFVKIPRLKRKVRQNIIMAHGTIREEVEKI